MITQNLELRGTRLIWRMLNEDFPEDVAKSFRGMRLCKDRKVKHLFFLVTSIFRKLRKIDFSLKSLSDMPYLHKPGKLREFEKLSKSQGKLKEICTFV